MVRTIGENEEGDRELCNGDGAVYSDLNPRDVSPPLPGIYRGQKYVIALRCLLALVFLTTYWNIDLVQRAINHTYEYILTTWLFNSVYFESFFATFCYGVAIPVYPWFVHQFRYFDEYKIHPSVRYEPCSSIFRMAVFYLTPLMFLDTFMVKKYHGVDPTIWTEKRSAIIQITRALPIDPPSAVSIAVQLSASFILYDALFFVIHLVLHRNIYLYKYIHKHHHTHGMLHGHVTNQLTVTERTTLVLSANFALKVFNSHPFTRMIFVPIFVGILVDNHTAYDMPFSLHRIIPFGIVGGSVKHFEHHMCGKRHYQPIFTYLDKLFDLYS